MLLKYDDNDDDFDDHDANDDERSCISFNWSGQDTEIRDMEKVFL